MCAFVCVCVCTLYTLHACRHVNPTKGIQISAPSTMMMMATTTSHRLSVRKTHAIHTNVHWERNARVSFVQHFSLATIFRWLLLWLVVVVIILNANRMLDFYVSLQKYMLSVFGWWVLCIISFVDSLAAVVVFRIDGYAELYEKGDVLVFDFLPNVRCLVSSILYVCIIFVSIGVSFHVGA